MSRTFPDATFRDDVAAIARELAAASPSALRAMKRNFVDAERMGLAEYVEVESRRHLEVAGGEDAREAFRAFVEKRPPRFTTRA